MKMTPKLWKSCGFIKDGNGYRSPETGDWFHGEWIGNLQHLIKEISESHYKSGKKAIRTILKAAIDD